MENKKKGKRIQEIFRIISNWNKQSKALKDKNPKLISEEMIFESEKETPLFI